MTDRSEELTRAMEDAVREGVFPAGVLLVGSPKGIVFQGAFGRTEAGSRSEETSGKTYFDLASLTKPLVTAAVALQLIERGEISLEDPVSRWISSWAGTGKSKVLLRHLLSHCSGLPAWRPLYEELLAWQGRGEGRIGTPEARRVLYERVHREELLYPVETRSEYSDLGFILLGEILERSGGLSLDRLADQWLWKPLQIDSLIFNPLRRLPEGASVAPTEACPWRDRILVGEVHDDHAFVAGGVAGHAGLFGTAEGVFRAASAWIRGDRGESGLFPQRSVQRFWERCEVPGGTFGLGWDTPSIPSSSGTCFSKRSVGHLGFTGTSLWIDRDRGRVVVLLTNRIHPSRQNEKIRWFRPRIHDLVMKEWG